MPNGGLKNIDMDQINREHILAAIQEIYREGIRPGRNSSTYDVIHEGKPYPPKLVISIANRFATGEELDSNTFSGGIDTPAFQLLEKEGFEIKPKKNTMLAIIENFIEQGNTNNLKTSAYPKDYKGLSLKVSFGQGVPARIPWIGLLKSPNTIQKGIYPGFLYYKEFNKLVLSYGVSETDESEFKWNDTENFTSIKDWHIKEFNRTPDRYGSSFIKNVYDLSMELDKEMIDKDVNEIINEYQKINFEKNGDVKYWLYAPGENASKWEEFFNEGVMGLGWGELGNLKELGDKNQITKEIQIRYKTTSASYNNALANLDFRDTIQIGDIIIPKRGRKEYLGYGIVTSEYYYDDFSTEYKSRRKVNWVKKGIWPEKTAGIVLKTLTDITKYRDYVEELRKLIGIEMEEQGTIRPIIIKIPLNQILYGPPGTGKTYRLQNEFFEKFTVKESSLSREQYLESIVADLSWWQVISIAVLDLGESKVNDIHNHEFVKFKENLSSSKTVRPTIWGQLQSHTVRECPNVNVVTRSEPLFFNKSEDSKWTIDKVLLEEYYPEAVELLAISKSYRPSDDITIKNYDFVTFHQSFSYEDFVEGIKPRLEDGETEVAFEIKDGIFKKLCIKAEADSKNKYAIFIDEINRGNVSAIFGELITLIEDDKRLGSTNELKVKLPYSKRELGVPSNLYIIGTMNTADRSVEALDTALRRRFSFSEIMPNPELLQEIEFNGFNLAEVLKTINERIEVLLDRDHTIGHSYFLKIRNGDVGSLKSVFKNNIFPLLQEYFYHDYEKIALILGEGFVRAKKNQTVKFAKFNDINTPDIGTQFELIDKIEDIEGAVHLLLNRNV